MVGLDVNSIVRSGGILLVGLTIFAETGLLIGFFLPGDTLLFTAGFFAAQGQLPLGWLLLVVVIAAIAGYEAGYEIGARGGKRIFTKRDGIFFRQEYIEQANAFYERHGGKTIILARFIPIVRTFAAVVAGVGHMDRRKFSLYNVLGAIPWSIGVTLLGYFLGGVVPNIDHYILPAILLATILTFGIPFFHALKDTRTRQRIHAAKKRFWHKITRK